MISNAMSSGGVNVIRKITRGTANARSGNKASISCTITNVDKVIVILDVSTTTSSYSTSAYLSSVSNTVVEVYVVNASTATGSITFSYQIIEFM